MTAPISIETKRIAGHSVVISEQRQGKMRTITLSNEGKELGMIRTERGKDIVAYSIPSKNLKGYKTVGAGGASKEKLIRGFRKHIVEMTLEDCS